MARRESQSANVLAPDRRYAFSIHVFKFAQHLLLQMASCSLFDGTSLRRYAFFFCLALLPCSRLHGLRHMPDLRALHTGFSLLWIRVGIHAGLALSVGDKISGIAASCRIVENNATAMTDLSRRLRYVKQSHDRDAREPCHAESGIKQTKGRASFLCWNNTSKHRLKKRTPGDHSNSPKNHSNESKG